MTRKFSLPALISPAALLLVAQSACFAAPDPAKPNIVLMIADDLTYLDLGCWGNKDVKTPNLDKLAAQGMRLTSCYNPAAVCSPTRQSLYTGLYPVRSGAYPNHAIVKPGVKSLPSYMMPLGYRVGLVGKTHFGPMEQYPFQFPERTDGTPPADGEDQENTLDYGAAARFIEKDQKQPYCLVVAPHEPHSPW
ncbi:sulfatase atsG, partial [bacterium]